MIYNYKFLVKKNYQKFSLHIYIYMSLKSKLKSENIKKKKEN